MNFKDFAAGSVSLALSASLVIAPWNEALAEVHAQEPSAADEAAQGEDGGEAAEPASEGDEAEVAVGAEGETAEGDSAEAAEGGEEAEATEDNSFSAAAELPSASEPAPEEGDAAAEEKSAEEASLDDLFPEPMFGDKYPATGRGMIIAGSAITGIGAAAILTSILITVDDHTHSLKGKLATQRNLFVPMSVAVTAVGLMLFGAGFGFKYRYGKWKTERAAAEAEQASGKPAKKVQALVSPVMMRGGGGLMMLGRF